VGRLSPRLVADRFEKPSDDRGKAIGGLAIAAGTELAIQEATGRAMSPPLPKGFHVKKILAVLVALAFATPVFAADEKPASGEKKAAATEKMAPAKEKAAAPAGEKKASKKKAKKAAATADKAAAPAAK
jgi:hypothetical protein